MDNQQVSKSEVIAFRGKLFEIVHNEQADGRVFEKARRAPGVRLIVLDSERQKVLLTREFRQELDAWDFRLPGGKVFDSLEEYDDARNAERDILESATAKAIAEGAEEAGLDIQELSLFKLSTLGATVEWDLFIFEVTKWAPHEAGQQLEAGENIEADQWFSFDEIIQKILHGEMREERVALVLLQWIESKKEGAK